MRDAILSRLSTPDGLRVWVIPGARREEIVGWVETEHTRYLKLKVTAPPEDGRANEAVIALLAKMCGVPKSRLAVASGQADRRKRVVLA